MKLHFKNLNIKEIKQGSAVFTGENRPLGFQDNRLVHDGFGTLNGKKNTYTNGKHIYANEELGHKKENPDNSGDHGKE